MVIKFALVFCNPILLEQGKVFLPTFVTLILLGQRSLRAGLFSEVDLPFPVTRVPPSI